MVAVFEQGETMQNLGSLVIRHTGMRKSWDNEVLMKTMPEPKSTSESSSTCYSVLLRRS